MTHTGADAPAGGRVCELLEDPAFAPLATEAVQDYLDHDELTRRQLPVGMSADETWRLLTAIRRFGAFRLPIRDLEGREYWYTLTREATLCLETIERYCRSDSSVHRAVLHRHGQRLLVDTNIREALAICQLDGVEIDPTTCRQMILSGRSPATAAERLVANVYALIGAQQESGGEKLSPQMLAETHGRLTDGLVRSELSMHAPRRGLEDVTETSLVSSEDLGIAIRSYCDYANDRIGDPSEPVAMKAYALLNMTHFWSFFPDFNGIIGRLVFKTYAMRRDYPVLGYLPVASLYKTWVDRAGLPSFVRFQTLNGLHTATDSDFDYTPDVLTHLQLTVGALDQMLSIIERGRERDAVVRAVLEHDPDLNFRQRNVIDRALAHPERAFRIREHQTTHNVVYATARADLLDLAARGYLVQGVEGKAFVFRATPDLTVRLGRA